MKQIAIVAGITAGTAARADDVTIIDRDPDTT